MKAIVVVLLLVTAETLVASAAAETSTKLRLIGRWQNSQNSPRCIYFPQAVTITLANDTHAAVTSEDKNGRVKVGSNAETQVVGPPTGEDFINFKWDSFGLIDDN